mgnify:CR=1 FL=1
MVRESLWHHFSSPQFWAPTGHVLSHYLPVVQFEKIGMEAVQTAWLLQLALLTARRRKHNLTIYIYSHVVCRRWYGKGCCGRCCCSPCARDGWPYSCFESWKAGLETPAAANQSRSQGPGWFNFILVCHVCVGEAVLTFHRATCTFIFPISSFFWWSCIAPASHHLYFQSFCFSSVPGERTTQSPEIGGQTEHQDLSWLLAFKMTRQQQQLLQNYMSHWSTCNCCLPRSQQQLPQNYMSHWSTWDCCL